MNANLSALSAFRYSTTPVARVTQRGRCTAGRLLKQLAVAFAISLLALTSQASEKAESAEKQGSQTPDASISEAKPAANNKPEQPLTSEQPAQKTKKNFQQLLSDSFEGAMQGDSRYIGHVRFFDNRPTQKIRFFSDEMLVKSAKDGEYKLMIATGKPAQFSQTLLDSSQSFEVVAERVEFHLKPDRLVALGNVRFVQQTTTGDKVEIHCQKIEILSHSASVQTVTASGSPLSFIHQKHTDEGTQQVQAQGNYLNFQSDKQQLTLKGNVVVNQGAKRLTAAEIFYDGTTGNVTVPRIPNQQLEIIQQSNAEKQNENP